MTPSFALQYISHVAGADTVLSGKRRCAFTLSMPQARFGNLLLCKFRTWVIRPVRMATFFYHICRVVNVRAEKMMCGVAARRVIAFVANKLPIRYGAMRQFVGDAMSQEGLTTTADMDSPVAVRVRAALPFPTIIGAKPMHLQPESVGNGAKSRVVPVNVAYWLALYMAAPVFVSYCNRCLLSATAVTVTVWDFLGRVVRGMILHSNVSFQDLLTPQDGSTHRCGNFMRFSRSIIAQVSA
jgi:hypothetical protein